MKLPEHLSYAERMERLSQPLPPMDYRAAQAGSARPAVDTSDANRVARAIARLRHEKYGVDPEETLEQAASMRRAYFSGSEPLTQAAINNPNRLRDAIARRLKATGRKPREVLMLAAISLKEETPMSQTKGPDAIGTPPDLETVRQEAGKAAEANARITKINALCGIADRKDLAGYFIGQALSADQVAEKLATMRAEADSEIELQTQSLPAGTLPGGNPNRLQAAIERRLTATNRKPVRI